MLLLYSLNLSIRVGFFFLIGKQIRWKTYCKFSTVEDEEKKITPFFQRTQSLYRPDWQQNNVPPSSLIGPLLVYYTDYPAPRCDVFMKARESLPLEWCRKWTPCIYWTDARLFDNRQDSPTPTC